MLKKILTLSLLNSFNIKNELNCLNTISGWNIRLSLFNSFKYLIHGSHIGFAVDSAIYLWIYCIKTYISIHISIYVMFCTNNISQYGCVEAIEANISKSIYHYTLIMGQNVHWVSLNQNTNHNSQRIYTFGEHQLKGALFTPHLTLNWLNPGLSSCPKGFLKDKSPQEMNWESFICLKIISRNFFPLLFNANLITIAKLNSQ